MSYRDLDFEDRPVHPQGQHVARMADITLATADDFQFDLDDPGYGFDLGPADGIGSQDFDLGLDFGDGPANANDDNMSVEMGRDAAAPRHSLDSHLIGRPGDDDFDMISNRSRDPSEHPYGADVDMDPGFGPAPMDMDIDLGLSFGDEPLPGDKTPGQTRSPSRGSEFLRKFLICISPDGFLRPNPRTCYSA